jgi:uncharacterized membrane protein
MHEWMRDEGWMKDGWMARLLNPTRCAIYINQNIDDRVYLSTPCDK